MCVFVHVCANVCMRACDRVCVRDMYGVFVSVYVCVRTCVCVRDMYGVSVYVYVCVRACACMSVRTRVTSRRVSVWVWAVAYTGTRSIRGVCMHVSARVRQHASVTARADRYHAHLPDPSPSPSLPPPHTHTPSSDTIIFFIITPVVNVVTIVLCVYNLLACRIAGTRFKNRQLPKILILV